MHAPLPHDITPHPSLVTLLCGVTSPAPLLRHKPAHTSRTRPVSSCCIMPCLMARVLSRRRSSAVISASMSESTVAIGWVIPRERCHQINANTLGHFFPFNMPIICPLHVVHYNDYEKIIRFSNLLCRRNRFISRAWSFTRTGNYPRIFLRRRN